jgi:hypothetical protein
MSSVHSGASSGSVQALPILGLFSVIGLPHRDYPAIIASPGPHYHHLPLIQKREGDEAILIIVAPPVRDGEGRSLEYGLGACEAVSLRQRSPPSVVDNRTLRHFQRRDA